MTFALPDVASDSRPRKRLRHLAGSLVATARRISARSAPPRSTSTYETSGARTRTRRMPRRPASSSVRLQENPRSSVFQAKYFELGKLKQKPDMAKVVDKIPEIPKRSSRVRRSRNKNESKYMKYFDGQIWQLELGVDCPAGTRGIYAIFQKASRSMNVEVMVCVRSRENAVYVQAKNGKLQ